MDTAPGTWYIPDMNERTISLEEIPIHLDRVHDQAESFTVTKNGKPYARLVPAEPPSCTGAELAAALRGVSLSPEESKAWKRDLARARRHLKPVRDTWKS